MCICEDAGGFLEVRVVTVHLVYFVKQKQKGKQLCSALPDVRQTQNPPLWRQHGASWLSFPQENTASRSLCSRRQDRRLSVWLMF